MFPKSTYIGKNIPKKRFYENIDLQPSLRKKFVNLVDKIVFANKFSSDTLNIPRTNEVEEIFVFDVSLKSFEKVEEVLKVIDQSVPYPILFQLRFGSKVLYKIAYKQRNKNNPNKSVVDVYLTKDGKFGKEFEGIFNALNMKILYENLLKLFLQDKGSSIEESVDKEKEQIYLKNEIERLEKLVNKEKQADRQYELHDQIKKLRGQLK